MKPTARFLSLFLALALCLGPGSLSAWADLTDSEESEEDTLYIPFPDVSVDASYAEAAATLYDMGIMTGDEEGNFNPDATITRGETAAILCRLMGVEDEAKQIRRQVFDDVPSDHWAVGYIAKASEMDVINGDGAGHFFPTSPVTYEQMVKMLVCAWGYGQQAEENGGWPDGYLYTANEIGLIDRFPEQTSAPASRALIAQLAYSVCNLPSNYEGGTTE